ncbi:MAG: LysR family transcriptional regulator [Deltaproteobacteria bacterium]|nr:MAG: LysR family transcriptional regulator [Deltaproteobacteria bacterium]
MDIKRLDLFCKVVDLKSFTRAAAEAGLSQPSVSEHIRLLEETVGEKLLDRLGRQVVPTPAGQRLYPYARRMVRLRDESLQAMAAFRGELGGPLHIGASTIPGTYILPRLAAEFHRRYPAAQLTVRVGDSEQVCQRVLSGEEAFGLVGTRTRDSRLEFVPVAGDRLVLIVPDDHPLADLETVTASQLKSCAFIRREQGSGTRAQVDRFLARLGVDPEALDVVAEMGSTEAVRQAVRAGCGVAFISSLAAEDEDGKGVTVLRVDGMEARRDLYLVTRRGRQLSPLAEAFVNLLGDAAGESD